MKKLIVAIVVVSVLAVAVLGWPKAVSYFKGGRSLIRQQVDRNSPDCLKVARIQDLLTDAEKDIRQNDLDIARYSWQAEDVSRTIADLQQKAEQLKQTLAHIRELLAQNRPTYVIGQHTFTQADIKEDAIRKMNDLERLQASLASYQQLLKNIKDGVTQGEVVLKDKQQSLESRRHAFELAKMENTVADMRLDVAGMQDRVSVSPVNGSELESAFREFTVSFRQAC